MDAMIVFRFPSGFPISQEFLLVEPENTVADLRAGPGEKKAATITLHCDMAVWQRQPAAASHEKKCRPPVGRRHQSRGLIPRYFFHVSGSGFE